MMEFLELWACLVRIKGRHALKWGTCSYSNTEQQYSTVARQRTSVRYKLAVCGDTGAGGLVASLPCSAYSGKLASYIVWLFLATASIGLVHLYSYHSLASPRMYLARTRGVH